jgi:hypothetical protein
VSLLLTLVAWLIAMTLVGALVAGFILAVREPVRSWSRGERRDALFSAIAVILSLCALLTLSRIVP